MDNVTIGHSFLDRDGDEGSHELSVRLFGDSVSMWNILFGYSVSTFIHHSTFRIPLILFLSYVISHWYRIIDINGHIEL